jgi:hypothetical protein
MDCESFLTTGEMEDKNSSIVDYNAEHRDGASADDIQGFRSAVAGVGEDLRANDGPQSQFHTLASIQLNTNVQPFSKAGPICLMSNWGPQSIEEENDKSEEAPKVDGPVLVRIAMGLIKEIGLKAEEEYLAGRPGQLLADLAKQQKACDLSKPADRYTHSMVERGQAAISKYAKQHIVKWHSRNATKLPRYSLV